MSTTSQNLLTRYSSEMAQEYYDKGFWLDRTIFQYCKDNAAIWPDKIAVRDRYLALDYSNLVLLGEAVASELKAAGLRPGERVASWLSSRCEVAIMLVACSKGGFVLSPSLHRNHTVEEVAHLIERMDAKAILWEQDFGADANVPSAQSVLQNANNPRHFIVIPPPGPRSINDVAAQLLKSPSKSLLANTETQGKADDIVYLAFTSGTTGEPKGVMHSNNTLLSNARSIAEDWDFNLNTVTCTLGPLSHNLGFGALILTLFCGGELIVHDLPRSESILQRLTETGTNFLFGVPAHAIDILREIEDNIELATPFLKRLKGFRISGASAPSNVIRRLSELGVQAQSGYGMTEACSHHYTLPDDLTERVIRTSGKACSSYEVQIFDPENTDKVVAQGEVGHIGGRGASLMMGYIDDQKSTEKSFNRFGWFMTGDLGQIDGDGYLTITGRLKEIIIRGGHNIHPAKIEQLATMHPNIEKAVALGLPDERLGEKVCLTVVPKQEQTIDEHLLLKYLSEMGLSKYDMPEYFLCVKEIPQSASGKLLKRALLPMIVSGQLDPIPVNFNSKSVEK